MQEQGGIAGDIDLHRLAVLAIGDFLPGSHGSKSGQFFHDLAMALCKLGHLVAIGWRFPETLVEQCGRERWDFRLAELEALHFALKPYTLEDAVKLRAQLRVELLLRQLPLAATSSLVVLEYLDNEDQRARVQNFGRIGDEDLLSQIRDKDSRERTALACNYLRRHHSVIQAFIELVPQVPALQAWERETDACRNLTELLQ